LATRPNRTKCPRRRLPTLLWSRKGSHGKHELQHRQSTFPLHTARRPPPRCYHAGKILRCTASLAAFRSHRRFSEVGLVQVWCRQQREQQQQRRRRRRRLVSIASSSASTLIPTLKKIISGAGQRALRALALAQPTASWGEYRRLRRLLS